jgi:AraC-like DNA-binding protein
MPTTRRLDTAARIAAVVRAIEADLPRDWTVAEMAAVLGVSDGQLRRLVAEGVDATPRHLLCNVRLQAAARLLADPGIRIKEVRTLVGLADASHFCRDFRDRFGMTPSEFRVCCQLEMNGEPVKPIAPVMPGEDDARLGQQMPDPAD